MLAIDVMTVVGFHSMADKMKKNYIQMSFLKEFHDNLKFNLIEGTKKLGIFSFQSQFLGQKLT